MEPLTVAALRQAALDYLARYPAPSSQVTRVLQRRIMRHHGDDRAVADYVDAIAEVVGTLVRQGLIDDAEYAASKVRVERRRGASALRIRAVLRNKGMDDAAIDTALDDPDADSEDAELAAAQRFAQRRRLGPHRRQSPGGQAADDQARKDLAAMTRAGFSFAIARRALDADDIDEDLD